MFWQKHLRRSYFRYGVAICILAFLSSHAWSDDHWSKGLSSRQRFVAYPHVDAGYRALAQKRFDVAVREFGRALELVPDNPVLVGDLAEAHAAMGNIDKAIAIIDAQLEKTPGVPLLTEARLNYERQGQSLVFQQAQSLRNRPVQLREYIKNHQPAITSAYAETVWIGLLGDASTLKDDLLASYQPRFPQNNELKRHTLLSMFLREGGYAQADALIDQWPKAELMNPRVIDGLSYEMLARGDADQSLRLLIRAYPFEQATAAQRGQLLTRMVIADSRSRNKQLMVQFLDQQKNEIRSSLQERDWLTLASATFGQSLSAFVNYVVRYPSNEGLLEVEIQRRLEAGASLPANVSWQAVVDRVGPAAASLVDTLTFRLVEDGSYEQAWALLIERYPFADQSAAKREELVSRMALIATRKPSLLTQPELKRISVPLDTVALRRLQASMLERADDCGGLRQVLGDMSASYTWVEWTLLGDCYQKQQRSGLAQYAFENAVRLNPTPTTQRAVAYAAYQNKDNETAVKAWRAVLQTKDLSPSDWFAATVTALATGDIDLARQWLHGYEADHGEHNAAYWALKARILSVDDLAGAIEAMRRSVEIDPVAGHYVEMAQWQDELGDIHGSIATLERAVTLQPSDGVAQADLGFRYFRVGQMRAAREAMQAALKLRPNDVAVTEQLAYIDQRLGENEESKRYIKLSVDHLLRYPSDELTAQEEDRLFSLRRMHEDLSRRWTLSFDALVGSSPAASVQSPVPGQNFKSYSQIEFDYRLGDPAINDGKTISAYARVFGGSGPQNSALPIYAPMLGVGLRWKPFSEQVIYLAVEQQIPLDHGTSAPANTMLRVSGSFFNSGEYSDDWHPVGPGWFTQNLYLDGAYYLRNQAYALTADYRFGYHHKVAQGQTIQPYVRALTNKVSNESTPDIRVGAGVRWNIWANQSRYSAYATRYYVGLELQGAIKTYQSDRVSAFLTLGARW
jgi:bacteriophage N4 adsorption protein A